MKIKILPPKRASRRNQFLLIMQFMHGDADAYTTVKAKIKKEEDVIKVLEVLKEITMIKRRPSHELLWEYQEKHHHNLVAVILDDWPGDATTDHDKCAALDNAKVVFYDADGIEHPVTFDGATSLFGNAF